MKKRSLLILFFIALGTVFSYGQEKMFTPEEVVGMNSALFPKNLAQLQWMGKSDVFSYVEKNEVKISSAQKVKTTAYLTLDEMNSSLSAMGEDSLKRLPAFKWLSYERAYYQSKGKLFELLMPGMKIKFITTLPEEADNVQIAPGSLKVAYTIDNDLYVAIGNEHRRITENPVDMVSGKVVHRNEFGIEKGIFWSDDESRIAFYRMDQSMVTDYPLVDISTRIATLKNEKYPMAGMKSHHVTIGVYDLNTQQTVYLETGEPAEQYLTCVSWQPDSKVVYTAILNREQNFMRLKAFDAQTGKELRTLFDEQNEHYVEPSHPLYFVPTKPDQFVWVSERDGFAHLYLYHTNGTLIKQLTKGDFEVTDFLGFDPKGTRVFYQSTEASPLERQTYSLEMHSLKQTLLTPEKGTHRSLISFSGNFVIDSYSSSTVVREINLLNNKGKRLENLLSAANPLQEYRLGKTEIIELKADDSTLLFGRLILPASFDPEKKYPVIVYVYGGPHAQLITDSWLNGAGFYLNYLSQKGYVVFTLDNRGSAHRGKRFEQVIHRQLGKVEMQDQLKGIEYLKKLPFVDENRIGVDGWSFGGFMSINLKLSHPEIFKVAVAGGPVIDWKYYEVMYGERYMDTPDENPDGYAAANLRSKVKNLEGKLLVIQGDMDPVVLWQHSLSFLKACVDEGKLVDYFVYPGHVHNVQGKDRAHLIRKISTYFDENL